MKDDLKAKRMGPKLHLTMGLGVVCLLQMMRLIKRICTLLVLALSVERQFGP
jgi:hypothetical protein